MGKFKSKKWPKRLAIITLFSGLLTYVIFSPANPNGIWNSRFFVAYADGSFAKLVIENNKYKIGKECVIFGEVKKSNPVGRTFELYNNGKYFISIKPYGPIILIGDSSFELRGWGYHNCMNRKWGQSSRINMKGVSWTGSVLNGANLRAVWGQIRVSRRSLWNEGLDADKARRMDVSITSHRRFGSDPQLFDFLPNFIKLAPFGSVLAW
jgi:hypothetical protein